MEFRFYKDPDTGLAHCRNHGVLETEVIAVLVNPGRQFRKKDGTLVAEGQTGAGRYLRIVYRRNDPNSIFVITAYDLTGNAKRAYRRARRKGK